MKHLPKMPSGLYLMATVVIAYAVLFQVVARTHMIERIMAADFTGDQFFLIGLFFATRFVTYLLIPSILAAQCVHALMTKLARR